MKDTFEKELEKIKVYGSGFTGLEGKKDFPYPMFREVDLVPVIKKLLKREKQKAKEDFIKKIEKLRKKYCFCDEVVFEQEGKPCFMCVLAEELKKEIGK